MTTVLSIAIAVTAALSSAGNARPGRYSAECAIPLNHWRRPFDGIDHHAISVRIRINGKGEFRWNGASVDEPTLVRYLEQMRELNPMPFPILDPDDRAPCVNVRHVRALMNSLYCSQKWRCGEGSGRWQPVMYMPDTDERRRLEDIADKAAAAADEELPSPQ